MMHQTRETQREEGCPPGPLDCSFWCPGHARRGCSLHSHWDVLQTDRRELEAPESREGIMATVPAVDRVPRSRMGCPGRRKRPKVV